MYQPQSSLLVCLGHYNMKNTKVNVIELIFEFDIYIYVTMINTSIAIHFFGVSPFENRDRGLGLSLSP